jgi:hypothetical protein
MSKARKTIMAAIRGTNNKKVNGSVENFEAKSEKKVVVNFTPDNGPQQVVDYEDLYFPHHKAATAAEGLKTTAITSWKSTNGANNAQEALHAQEFAQFVPAD